MSFNPKLPDQAQALISEYRKAGVPDRRKERIAEQIIDLLEPYVLVPLQRSMGNRSPEDVAQEARIGIFNAIRTYDPSRGSFVTWAVHQVRGTVGREKSTAWIRIPVYVQEITNRVNRWEAEYRARTGQAPSDEETCEGAAVSARDLAKVRAAQGLTKLEIMEDSTVSPHSLEEQVMRSVMVKSALARLPDRHRRVIDLYYFQGLNTKDIGDLFDVTPQRIQEIMSEAKAKLASFLADQKEADGGVNTSLYLGNSGEGEA